MSRSKKESITSFTGKYKFLSNFYPCFNRPDGLGPSSVEHHYQAAKTISQYIRDEILCAPTPAAAKRMAKHIPDRYRCTETIWRIENESIMLKLLRMKFLDPDLRCKLLATGDAELIHGNNHGDTFWGTVDGVGKNILGKMLMQIRSNILAEELKS